MNKLSNGYKVFLFNLIIFLSASVLAETKIECKIDVVKTAHAENKFTVAKAIFQLCKDTDFTSQTTENIADLYFYMGLIYRTEKNLSEAQGYFEKAIQRIPKVFYRLEYAVSLEWDKKLALALQQYNTILMQERKNNFALHGKARVLRWQRQLKESRQVYNILLTINPDDLQAKTGIGFIELMDKKYKKAKIIFSHVLQEDSNNAEAKLGLQQLMGLKNHHFTYETQTRNKSSATDKRESAIKQTLSLRSEYNNRWTGYYNFEAQDQTIDEIVLSREGLAINREAKYSISALALYNGLNFKYLGGLNFKKSFMGEEEYLATLQIEKSLNNKHRWHLGLRPSIAASKINSTLVYGGYFKPLNKSLDLQTQVFYVSERGLKNSSSLVATLLHRPTTKISNSYGFSVSRNLSGNEKLAFLDIAYSPSDRTRLSINAVKNLTQDSSELTIGIKKEF